MRIPYYLAQYQQTEAKTATGSTPTILPIIVVGGIVLLYVGILVFLLLGLGQ